MRSLATFSAFLAGIVMCTNLQAQDRSIVLSYQTDTAPVIDGEIDGSEWDAAGPWIEVNAENGIFDTGIDEDVYGGDADLSYRFKSMWVTDTTNFYFVYEVVDDIAMDTDPTNLWERDQVESFFDGTNLDGDDDPATYEWWVSDETYGKFGVSREGTFEGNDGNMTNDESVWDDGFGGVAAYAAALETGNNADYRVELAVSIDPMLADSNFVPYEGTPTEDAGWIVADSTKIKYTVSLADDDNFDTGDTERSHTMTYFRDPEDADWRLSTAFADLVFTGEYVAPACDAGTEGDIDGNGNVEFADFLILSGNFGNAATDHTTGDIDCSGTVDFADFLVLSGNFGNSVGQAAAVPEPSESSLLLFVAVLSVSLYPSKTHVFERSRRQAWFSIRLQKQGSHSSRPFFIGRFLVSATKK